MIFSKQMQVLKNVERMIISFKDDLKNVAMKGKKPVIDELERALLHIKNAQKEFENMYKK